MDKKVKILLMDDIHIEGRNPTQVALFQKEVREKINEIKTTGFIPILICAGDIGEGIAGIEWVKDFECDVIYTCGNHEFWNRDYFETYKNISLELEKPEYKHVHFINDNKFELHGVRFLGGTMWTSVGSFLNWYDNKNLAVKYFPVMGDFRKITIKGWYTPENIKRLNDFMSANISQMNPTVETNIKSLIENEYFNPLFELDVHTKTLNFIKEELSNSFSGKTVVVTHHLPDFKLWAKAKKMNTKVLEGEYLNNDRLLMEGAKGNNRMYRDAMLIGYYSNNLSNLMYGELAPDYWVHGHLHVPVHSIIGKTKVLSCPVGYHSQSSVMSMKEFCLEHTNKFIGDTIRKNVEDYAWDENIMKVINDFDIVIKTFEPLVQSNLVMGTEFKVILSQFKSAHQNNIDQLKKDLTEWLSPLIYQNNHKLGKVEHDYFNVILKSGILMSKVQAVNGEDIKFKLPDYLNGEIGSASFKEDKGNENKNTHVKYWKNEIQKITVQVKNLKKLLLEFANDLEGKDK